MQSLSLEASQLCSTPAQDCPPIKPAWSPLSLPWAPGPLGTVPLSSNPCSKAGGLKDLSSWEAEPGGARSFALHRTVAQVPPDPAPVTLPFPSQDTLSGSFRPFSEVKENKRAASRSTRTKEPLSVESGARGRGQAFIRCHEPAALRSLAPPPFPVKLPSYVSLACLFSSVMLSMFTWSHCCATNLQTFFILQN